MSGGDDEGDAGGRTRSGVGDGGVGKGRWRDATNDEFSKGALLEEEEEDEEEEKKEEETKENTKDPVSLVCSVCVCV